MIKKHIITLTTDFGMEDSFVGLMKGVIFGINPDVNVVDITHSIARHDISGAAQVISMSYRFFPSPSVHVVVVDPGVGSGGRPLMVITKDHYFLGPDNGVFSGIYDEDNSGFLKVIHLTAKHHFGPMERSTFDGRDIYAPVAAWFSKGIESDRFGDEITDYVTIPGPRFSVEDGNVIRGAVVSIDHFGNAITNIRRERLRELLGSSCTALRIAYGDRQVPLVHYYEEQPDPAVRLSAIINSFGLVELFVTRGSAAREFGISVGDEVTVTAGELL